MPPACWGFATSADKQRLEAFLRRGVRLNLYSALDPSVSQRVQDTDDELFSAVMANSHHVLHHMLPDRTSATGVYAITARVKVSVTRSEYLYHTSSNSTFILVPTTELPACHVPCLQL